MKCCQKCGNEHAPTFELVEPGQTRVFLCVMCAFNALDQPYVHTIVAESADDAFTLSVLYAKTENDLYQVESTPCDTLYFDSL
jgi:hypothetical protein